MTWQWRQAQPQGRLRKPCEGHTVSVVEHCLYVLFGKHEDDSGAPICPPMQIFDTSTLVLTSPGFEPSADGQTGVGSKADSMNAYGPSKAGVSSYTMLLAAEHPELTISACSSLSQHSVPGAARRKDLELPAAVSSS